MDLEEKIKINLLIRGFSEKTIINNRGLIGAVIDETILEVVKNNFKEQSKWISVKDQLPVDQKLVIVSGIYEGERYCHYAYVDAYGKEDDPNEKFTIPGWSDMNVDYWQPMPDTSELPQPEEDAS